MEIEESSLWREVRTIVDGDVKPVHYTWSADIHANGETHKALKVLSVDLSEDYEMKFGDEIMVKLAISGGTYAKRIYPYQGEIEITLYRSPLRETSDVHDEEENTQAERYSATLVDTGSIVVEGSGENAVSEESLNLTNIIEADFQLINKALQQLRVVVVGGIFRNTTVENVIKGVLTAESKKVEVEGVRMPQGVDMIPASNQNRRDHIVIPHGTRLVDVPEYVHRKCGGVYSAGLGYYLRGDYWYIYPCYDVTRFAKAARTLTVINVPKNKMPQVERTYRQNGNNLVVLATGDTKFSDDSEVQQLNKGNGVRFSDANQFMTGFVKTKDNKTVASRGANNSEFSAFARKDGIAVVPFSPRPINANPFVEFSAVARREGGVFAFVWENSLPSLIFPGMVAKVLFLDDEDLQEAYGVILKAHHYTQTRGQGMTETRYVTSTMLSIFVNITDQDS